jgi:hypothetical protein
MPVLYHGGVPGLDPGELLLPGAEVGASHSRCVKVTPDLEAAIGFAARWPGGGDVYRVRCERTEPPPSSGFSLLRVVGPAVVAGVIRRGVRDPKAMRRPELARVKPIKRRSDG